MPYSKLKIFRRACVFLLFGVAPLFPQATAVVQISGNVVDPAGAAVGGAEVKATRTSTGFTRTVITQNDGSYIVPNLPVGPYRLEVSAKGFKTYAQEGIVLQVNTNPQVNVKLEVGELSQKVEVSVDAAMVETQSTGISQVIDQKRVVDLPLNGRQPTQLILLSGAAVTAPPSDIVSSKNYPTSTAISVAGGQANGTYYLMDGGDHNDAFGSINLPLPFPDALQEFSVQTSTAPASYGVRGGAVVNVVTKSGTNQFHGGVFEFLRNGVTNARPFFAPQRDSLKRNQFGGTMGGPVLQNKLFFFAGYQGTRTRTAPQTKTVFVPTLAALAGDFRTLESRTCGAARTLIDPNTRQPFPTTNIVSPSRFNAQALGLLKYLPTTADPCGKVLMSIPDPQDEDQGIGRADWILSDKQSLFGRYFVANYREPGIFDGNNLLLTNRAGLMDGVQSLTIGHTYTLSPAVVNSIHATGSRKRIARGPASNLPQATDLGLNIANLRGNTPDINVGSHFEVSCGTCASAHINNDTLQLADDLNYVRGRHQLAFGVDWIYNSLDFLVGTQQVGSYSFDGSATGDQLADFLLGTPVNFVQGNATRMNSRQTYFGLYGQDHFRVNSHLTLNAGLRWEPYFPVHDVTGRATHFDLNAYAAGLKTTIYHNAPPGMFFPGDKGMTDSGTSTHLANFAPRFGFIWDPRADGRMTVRASYGIFFDTPDMQFFDRFGFGPPWASTITIFTPGGGFTNPYQGFPGGNPFPQPTPPRSDAFFPQGGQFVSLPLHIRPTYMQQWNLTLERQVGTDWLVSASYIGNKSTHRWLTRQADPAVYIQGNCGGSPCSTVGNSNSRRILSRIDPTGGALISSLVEADDGGNANYNAMKLSINHRLNRHFSVLANYTWSHCISNGEFNSELAGLSYQDPANREADRGNCIVDQRQIFNTSAVFTSPRFSSTAAQRFLGNWELSTILTKRTGFWFSPGTGRDASFTSVGLDRPNVTADSHVSDQGLSQWFNTSAFVANAPGKYGNAGRDSLEGPGSFTFDAALMRRFAVTENQQLEVRAEAFNILNHPVFGNPRSAVSDSNFGRILSSGDPRILQFALKYSF